MSYLAKLFQNGGSQADRRPKECRFEGQEEVAARREGRRVILEPIDRWRLLTSLNVLERGTNPSNGH